MKKIIGFACIVFLLLTLSVPTFAQETVITADVPESHTVNVIISNNGKIVLDDGKAVFGKQQIERHKKQRYRIIPKEGKQLDKLLYNGEDVTSQVKNGVYIAPALVHDAVLVATYKDVDVPQTNENKQSSQNQSNSQSSEVQSSQPSLLPTGDNSIYYLLIFCLSMLVLYVFSLFLSTKNKKYIIIKIKMDKFTKLLK